MNLATFQKIRANGSTVIEETESGLRVGSGCTGAIRDTLRMSWKDASGRELVLHIGDVGTLERVKRQIEVTLARRDGWGINE